MFGKKLLIWQVFLEKLVHLKYALENFPQLKKKSTTNGITENAEK